MTWNNIIKPWLVALCSGNYQPCCACVPGYNGCLHSSVRHHGLCAPSQQVAMCPACVISVVIHGSRCALWHLWGGSSAFVFRALGECSNRDFTAPDPLYGICIGPLLHPWCHCTNAGHWLCKRWGKKWCMVQQLACREALDLCVYFHMKGTFWNKVQHQC